MKHIRLNALVVLILVSVYVSKKVDGSDGDFSVNVAYGKPAYQSSTYLGNPGYGEPNGFPYIATLAVDGIKNNNFHGDSCSHTNVGQSYLWWEVDLQGLYDVSSIKIYQRVDANPNSLEGFIVDGKQSNANYFTINQSGPYSTGNITISLQPKRQLKSIRIRLRKDNALICLCEVEVFAEVNVALEKSASQSSTYDGSTYKYANEIGLYNASLAVDGNTNTKFSSASCSQTTPNTNTLAWWKVTLNGPYAVIGLRIYQRTDGSNTKWLIGYQLYGQLGNNRYEKITIPPYQPGVINIRLQHVKIFSEIKVELDVEDFRGICLCEVQVFAGIMCPDPPSIRNNSSRQFIPGVAGYESFGSSVIIDCVKGYMLIGSNSVKCTEYNVWNGQLGNCIDIDECNMGDYACHNHGHCTNTDGAFSCECTNGYTGLTCETDIDECTLAGICHYHGHCSNIDGSFACNCSAGYKGTTCENDIDECKVTDSVCHNHGRCTNTYGGFSCECANGYTGIMCETDIDECEMPHPACHNHGQCTNTVGGFSCLCNNSYTGDTCDMDIDECTQAGICHYHGHCFNIDGSFACNCSAGYKGTTCENDIDECTLAGICHYHGQCSNIDGSFACNCSAGYKGTTCENDIDECTMQDSACHNHGQCSNTEGSFECQCSNGYVGPTCKTAVPEQSSAAGIAGGVTAAICLLIIGVIIAFIMYKRRARRPEDKIVDTSLDELRSSSDKKEYAEGVILETSISAQPMDINNPNQDPEYDESKTVYMNRNYNSRDYYSFTPEKLTDKHSIRVEDLASFILNRKKEPNLYEEEYNNLPDGLTRSYEAALLPENKSKNRYKNIYPYDDTRVKLEIWDTSNESDYINANYVNGFKTYHTYIAAQGPTKEILNDFWRMIWQTKCSKIVMLTNLMEEGKHKCEQYWPDEGSVEYGNIVIRLIQCEKFSDFTIRTLSIGKKNGKSKRGKTETHQIIQFHFTAWPDRGVPRFASSLVHFRQKIRAAHTKQQAEGPTVVHCSAGIGRTGTFLVLDYLLEQAEEVGYINVVKCLETIRKQRVNLVQTLGQYIFLHEALLEALTCTALAVSTSEFQETHKKLTKMDKSTRKRMLDDEFEKLPMYVSDPEEDVYENAKNMGNRHKNRYSNILPDKNHCPFLNVYVKGRDSYINAVFLPAYKENNIFIITQTPLENTIVDFWRMVYQFEVGSIVMLNTLTEMKEEERYWKEDKKGLETGPFRITLESKSCDDISTNYTMLLHYNNESRRVRLSRATYWADGKPVPMSPTTMLKQIDLIEKWQQESGSKPIIVHCMNGAERSGLFCVITALLERTKIEQDVAVEQIIKQMRSRRPQIIPNVEQFRFCYDAMLAYLNTFDTYSNFTSL